MGGDFLGIPGEASGTKPSVLPQGRLHGKAHPSPASGTSCRRRRRRREKTSTFLCGNVRTSRRKVPHFQRQSPDVSATPDKHRNFRCPQAWGISRTLQKRHRKTSRPASQPRVGGKSRHRARNPTRGTLTGAVRRGGIYGTPSRLCPQDKKKSASAVHRGTCRCGFFRGTLSFRLPSRRIACRALRSGFSAP